MFTINLQCKPYVKQFLVLNCSNPVDLVLHKDLHEHFKLYLARQTKKREAYYRTLNLDLYCETVEIIIPDDDFYRFGWELNISETVNFGQAVERHAKLFMHTYVAYHSTFLDLKTAILQFQEKFGFYENIWKYESIRKDFFRNQGVQLDPTSELSGKFEKIIMGILSKSGTLTNLATNNHENNK